MRSPRYVVYGPGAVGGTIAVELVSHGHEVALIARGAHADAIEASGLVLDTPVGALRAEMPVVRHPEELDWRDGDVVLLCVKSGDTEAAVQALADLGLAELCIACVQNGVLNEEIAAKAFDNVYGVMLWMPVTHLEPGRVIAYGEDFQGSFIIGRAAGGVDALSERLAADLSSCRFRARTSGDVMRWKRGKLLHSLGNAADAFCQEDDALWALVHEAQREGMACFDAAELSYALPEDVLRETSFPLLPVGGAERPGGSTWQSLQRGQSDSEVPSFNGWICELGVEHGVATPVNRAFLELAMEVAKSGQVPRQADASEVARRARALGWREGP